MIETLVTVLHILTCLALILAILLQSGKGGGVSAAFGGGAGQALGQRSATTVLGRFTGIASAVFMVTSMALAIYSTSEYRDETLRDLPAEAPASTDAAQKAEADKKAAADKKADGDKQAPADAKAPQTDTPKNAAPTADAPSAPADAPAADAPPADDAKTGEPKNQ
ncbi:MAG: preprotein translocase subunit SecG [Myxococcota bacterium]|nr:preprotein translocase subunit SecG [Myxococcota bacterium]